LDKKERKREQSKKYYAANKEKILEKKKKRRADFPEIQKAAAKAHYENNKQSYIERSANRKKSLRAEWAAFKATLSCERCGENHPATFDFHHVVRDKSNEKVHKLVGNGSYARALEEIKKCIVLCANCHRKLHYEEELEKKRAKKPKKKPSSSVKV